MNPRVAWRTPGPSESRLSRGYATSASQGCHSIASFTNHNSLQHSSHFFKRDLRFDWCYLLVILRCVYRWVDNSMCHKPCLIMIRSLPTAPQRTTMSHTEQPALQQDSVSAQYLDSDDAPRSLRCRDSTLKGNFSSPSKELSNTGLLLICSACKSIDWQKIFEKLQQGRQRLRNIAEIF